MTNLPKLPTNKNFGIIFALIFAIISLLPVLKGNDIRIWSLALAIIFFVLGFINSKLLTPFNQIWFKFGIFLGNIIAPLIMGIVYFFVITPTGLITKLLGKDLLNLKKNKLNSYRIKREKDDSTMKNQF